MNTKNLMDFGPLLKMVGHLVDAGWLPLRPDSDKARAVAQKRRAGEKDGINLEQNVIMHRVVGGEERWCYVGRDGTATLLDPERTRTVEGDKAWRLTRNERKWKKFWPMLADGWTWDSSNKVAVAPVVETVSLSDAITNILKEVSDHG